MIEPFYIAIAVSETVSLVLILGIWRKNQAVLFKAIYSLIAVIPIIGPLLYLFASDSTAPQSEHMQNNGPRGEYMHRWISNRELYEKILRDKENREKQD